MTRDPFTTGATTVHRFGIPWADAPTPPRWHTCTQWTRHTYGHLSIERCACGAARWISPYGTDGAWVNRNHRRKTRRR